MTGKDSLHNFISSSPPPLDRLPRKHMTLNQFCFNVGPTSKMVGNIKTTLVQYHVFAGYIRNLMWGLL